MSATTGLPTRGVDDAVLAGAAVAALAFGTVLAGLGTAAGRLDLLASGALAAGAALVLLVAAGWLDGLVLIALAVPLPALYRTESLRIAAALPITALVVFAWVLRWGTAGERAAFGGLPRRATAALLLVFAVATLLAQSPALSVRELVNFALLLGLLAVAADAFVREPERRGQVAAALVAAGAVCGVLALLETLAILPGAFVRAGTRFNRAALGFGQPNGLGLFLALVLPFAASRLASARRALPRTLNGLAVLAIALGLLGTFSRGSWLAVLFGTAPLWLTRERGFAVRVWAVGLALAVAFDLGTGGSLRAAVANTATDWSVAQRAALMWAGVLTFLAHPVLGVGPGGFIVSLDEVGLQVPQLEDLKPTPHNAFIQMAAEAGVFGLVAFTVFLLVLLRVLMRGLASLPRAGTGAEDPAGGERSLRRAVLWSFGVLCVGAFFDWPFPHGTGQVAMLVAAMGCAAVGRRESTEP